MTTASDNFSGGDENPIGGNWTNYTGANKVVSGVAGTTAAFAGNLTGYSGASWSGDHESQVTVAALDATDYEARGVGPAVRIQTVDGSGNYGYALQIAVSDSRVVLQRAGDASVAVGAVNTTDWANGDIAKLVITGTAIDVYKNGSLLYSRTDSTLSNGRPGFAVMRSGQTVDAWSGADVASTAAVVTGTITTLPLHRYTFAEDGGKTWIATLTGETYNTPFDSTITTALTAGISAASSPANGWNAKVRDAAVNPITWVRTSATVATGTMAIVSDYAPAASEVLTMTIPAVAVVLAAPIVATPTITTYRGPVPSVTSGTCNGSGVLTCTISNDDPNTANGEYTETAMDVGGITARTSNRFS